MRSKRQYQGLNLAQFRLDFAFFRLVKPRHPIQRLSCRAQFIELIFYFRVDDKRDEIDRV
jgi:hypothetical protein